ncbi:MAG: lantibiotic dehydratase C-terminal domain-containing protein, partial [Bacteroidota bacterium]
ATIVYGTDEFLSDFGLKLPDKLLFAERMRDNYAKEVNFDNNPTMKNQLKTAFRREKNILYKFSDFNGQMSNDPVIQQITAIIKRQSSNTVPVIRQIVSNTLKNEHEEKIESLMSSYIHMFLNRFYPENQRTHEFMMYDIYYHFLKSWKARAEKSGKMKAISSK